MTELPIKRADRPSLSRRRMLQALAVLALPVRAQALSSERLNPQAFTMLDGAQSELFRAWFTFIVAEQFTRGPSPRWYHRDCAGLARFAVGETLRSHDARWRQANGMDGRRLPPELVLRADQSQSLVGWNNLNGSRQSFATALMLIQGNTRALGRESAMARPGDLLFFDQGDDQHLMIWMGSWIAYHNGQTPVTSHPAPRKGGRKTTSSNEDSGLRAVTPAQLLQWKDTRWRPRDDNPNFAGFYRLAFLSR
jgi:uncharacterized protein YfaT (DUF1175 family)